MLKFLKPKLILVAIILATLFFSVFSVSAMTETERQALIESIKQQIIALQLQIAQLQSQTTTTTTTTTTSSTWCHTFNVNLGTANNGSSEVGYLQTAMQKQGFVILATEIANNRYGTSTVQAVTAFQQKYASEILTPSGLTKGTGFFGTATRSKLNQFYSCDKILAQLAQKKSVADTTTTTTITSTTAICTPSWKCGSYGQCVNGNQTRTCFDINGCGSVSTKPSTTQSCVPEICIPTWTCGNWSACANSQQTRTCTDSHNCNTTAGRPLLTKVCTSSCVPSWTCGDWSACSNNQQTRTCTDSNNCDTTIARPNLTRYCSIRDITCTPNWICGSWDTCSSGSQTRTCTDLNSCDTTTNKPSTSQSCVYVCTPNWTCGGWGTCLNNQQTRTCTDSNNCGTVVNKPATTQTCTSCTPAWTCGNWSVCANSQQTRTCTDSNSCGTTTGKPATTQACTTVATITLPQSWDWRTKGVMTPVKNQGPTDTCTHFAMVGAFEADVNVYYSWKTVWKNGMTSAQGVNYNADISEQASADCVLSGEFKISPLAYPTSGSAPYIYGGDGFVVESCDPFVQRDKTSSGYCAPKSNGGAICDDWQTKVWKPYGTWYAELDPIVDFLVSSNLCSSADGEDYLDCHYASHDGVYSLTQEDYPKGKIGTEEIKYLIYKKGPLSMYTYSHFFSTGLYGFNHAVVLVGWGYDSGGIYWIIKNSWGTGWQDGGYDKLQFPKKSTTFEILKKPSQYTWEQIEAMQDPMSVLTTETFTYTGNSISGESFIGPVNWFEGPFDMP